VVLGGGLSGLAAAWEIAGAGFGDVTIVERSAEPGGLASSFEHAGHYYPLGYHHILPTDATLLRFLDLIGALPDVHWRRIKMLFRVGGEFYDFSKAADFVRLPLPLFQKLRFAGLMVRAYQKKDWSDWEGRTARELVDSWGGTIVREAVFEPLCDLKFELPSDEVSGAWMGTRLHAREGSGRLGYIPGTNWTRTLCEGMVRLVHERGVAVRTGAAVTGLGTHGRRVHEVELDGGDSVEADVIVSAMPTNVLARLLPGDPQLDFVDYTALLSLVGGTHQAIPDDFYWLNLLSPRLAACGIFLLTSLNPTIGGEGERCVNFVTHLRSPREPLFNLDEDDLLARYLDDYKEVFGIDLDLDWANLSRIPAYSPVFTPTYRNPDVRSAGWENLYLTGNYRTYPSVASTGTALRAGVETGEIVIEELRGRRPTRVGEKRRGPMPIEDQRAAVNKGP
jgi:protoporphyrinogen oxidase